MESSIKRIRESKLLTEYGPQTSAAVALIIMCIILTFLTPSFLTAGNILSVLLQCSVNSILALGMTFIIITAGIDLSVGAVVAFSAAIGGFLMQNYGLPPLLGLILILLLGICAGFLNGSVITRVGIPAFIVTLGSMQIWRGLALQLTQGGTSFGFSALIKYPGQGKFGPVPFAAVLVIVLYVLGSFILRHTTLGLNTYAIGGNEQAAKLSGIKIRKTKMILYCMNGLLCGVAGLVLMGRLDSSTGIMANGYEMNAIAAVIIGGASFFGGEGNVWGSLIGAVLMGVLSNGLNLLGVSSYMQTIVIGCVIVLAVSIDAMRRKMPVHTRIRAR